jgi:hypothetical protein
MNSVLDRIGSSSIPEPNSGCWLWLGALSNSGYGRIMITHHGVGKVQSAHRVSWREVNGEIPGGMYVLHRCDQRSCVNPDHLFLGTQQDNMNDMVAKGRTNPPQRATGEAAHLSKLTDAQAHYVLSSPKTGRSLATELGVSKSCISSLRTGYSWKHLHKQEQSR